MKNYILMGAFISFIMTCNAQEKFIVTKPGEEPQNTIGRFIYSLPRTVVLIKMNFEKEIYIPGPYRMYSEKYLSIPDFINKSETKWRIMKAEMSAFSEPDPLHFYTVNLIKGVFRPLKYLELGEQGLILNPNHEIATGVEGNINEKIIEPPYFTDLSLEENFISITDTLYKTIIKDTTFVRLPVIRKQREARTLEQKAEEAANLIMKIRKKRFKLETGSEEQTYFPEGIALATAIGELNKLEKEYLSLFIGKIYTQKYSQSFFITPSGKSENITFARFSLAEGILASDSPKGEAIIMEISPLGTTDILKKNFTQETENEVYNTFYYRIPEVTSVRLLQKDRLLYESRFTIFQAGSLASMPVEK